MASPSVTRLTLAGLVVGWLLVGCAPLRVGPEEPEEPMRLSELVGRGDPARRAGQLLVLRGLEEDGQARPVQARASYERALQVDPTNPYAYLALARHEIDAGEPERALAFLDQAETLLPGERDADPSRVESHLLGLRGAALLQMGRMAEGRALLTRARQLAPAVWDDARLDALELR